MLFIQEVMHLSVYILNPTFFVKFKPKIAERKKDKSPVLLGASLPEPQLHQSNICQFGLQPSSLANTSLSISGSADDAVMLSG